MDAQTGVTLNAAPPFFEWRGHKKCNQQAEVPLTFNIALFRLGLKAALDALAAFLCLLPLPLRLLLSLAFHLLVMLAGGIKVQGIDRVVTQLTIHINY